MLDSSRWANLAVFDGCCRVNLAVPPPGNFRWTNLDILSGFRWTNPAVLISLH